MAELTVDLTYGSALYQAAVETNKKDLILDEAFQVQDVFENNPDFFHGQKKKVQMKFYQA